MLPVCSVAEARAAARDWVVRHGRQLDGYRGAFVTGSTVELADDDPLPPASDVDVVLVADAPAPGKFRHRGVLLEVSTVPWAEVGSAGTVLSTYYLAGAFRRTGPLDDPAGGLTEVAAGVAAGFAREEWVRRRCLGAYRRIQALLDGPRPGAALPDGPRPAAELADQVTGWVFAAGVTTHVLLVAALRNPTVRLRYPAVRAMLTEYGLAGHYPDLLRLLGAADLTAAQVRSQLATLATTFDATAAVARTPFPFSGDLTVAARPVAIDGSRALIEAGDPREAVFWIVATLARCHTVLATEAPDLHRTLLPGFRAVLADLDPDGAGIAGRLAAVRAYLPRLRGIAGTILAANPEIEARTAHSDVAVFP